jgi:hypothetical protein
VVTGEKLVARIRSSDDKMSKRSRDLAERSCTYRFCTFHTASCLKSSRYTKSSAGGSGVVFPSLETPTIGLLYAARNAVTSLDTGSGITLEMSEDVACANRVRTMPSRFVDGPGINTEGLATLFPPAGAAVALGRFVRPGFGFVGLLGISRRASKPSPTESTRSIATVLAVRVRDDVDAASTALFVFLPATGLDIGASASAQQPTNFQPNERASKVIKPKQSCLLCALLTVTERVKEDGVRCKSRGIYHICDHALQSIQH